MTHPILRLAAFAIAAGFAAPLAAQEAPPAPVNDGSLRVNQVSVYGDDPCPQGQNDEIVVCRRYAEDDRYRIPEELRADPNDPRRESWSTRVQAIERVGRFGTDSCSPTGAGGFTGCTADLINNAYAERRQAAGNDWTDAVAAARQERMDGFDAEARAIEEQVTRDEQARVERERQREAEAAAAAAQPATPGQPITDPDAQPLPRPPGG